MDINGNEPKKVDQLAAAGVLGCTLICWALFPFVAIGAIVIGLISLFR